MSILFFCEDVELPDLKFDIVKKVLKRELQFNKFKLGNLNFIFCSDDYLLRLNVEFLQHDYYTDVITFDFTDNDIVAGDIYISTERVMNNASIFDESYRDELIRVISHGFLHLLKFNDKEAEEIQLMRKKESELLGKVNSHI
jgi:probable rRNA maturation factor